MSPPGSAADPLRAESTCADDDAHAAGEHADADASHTGSRMDGAWREWLGALARDAEAAHAAAMAYKALDPEGREVWIEALRHDAEKVGVPRFAVYAPLLAVESDPGRRERIQIAIGPMDHKATPNTLLRALGGRTAQGIRVAVIVSPLYLDFVQVLACGYRPGERFVWVRHDPIVCSRNALSAGDSLEGVVLDSSPLKPVLDELASTIVAHARSGERIPEALSLLSDLLVPSLDVVDGVERWDAKERGAGSSAETSEGGEQQVLPHQR